MAESKTVVFLDGPLMGKIGMVNTDFVQAAVQKQSSVTNSYSEKSPAWETVVYRHETLVVTHPPLAQPREYSVMVSGPLPDAAEAERIVRSVADRRLHSDFVHWA